MRQGLGAGCGREGSPHAQSLPPPHPRVCACDRRAGRARAFEPKRCASQRNRKFAGGGSTSGRKSSNWSSRAKPTGGRARSRRHASRPGPRAPRAGASAARRTRPVKKREKGGRPKGTDSRGGAPDARRKQLFPRSSKDTLRPEHAPAGMLQGLPIAAERRAVGWGNGEGAGEGSATLTAASPLRGRPRAARSGLCRPPLGYFFAFPG